MKNEIQTRLDELEQDKNKQKEPQKIRPTYSQDWQAYNKAKCQEKIMFLYLLKELVEVVPEKKIKTKGRPFLSMQDMLFSVCLMLYCSKSSRRANGELKIAQQLKLIQKKPHFNTVLNYLRREEVTPILKHLITLSALPLKPFEEHFTLDSSGFSTSIKGHWMEHK